MKSLHVFLIILVLLFLTACAQSDTSDTNPEDNSAGSSTEQRESSNEEVSDSAEENPEEKAEEESEAEGSQEKESEEKASEEEPVQVGNPEDILVLVNKSHLLPEGYEPPDLVKPDVPFYFEEDIPKRYMREEAANALEELFKAAQKEKLNLVAASGYRSYERQERIYKANVEKMGQEEADKVSAFPGASEHQTGLAIDVTSPEMGYGLDEAFGDTEEGKWLADHAYKYGFIIRYPEGRTEDTGYNYEPWHLRYVGEEAAGEIHEKELILEEYVHEKAQSH